jgi:transposase InsO family protein
VVGWSMSATMTAQLVTDALVMAIWRRGKPDALLHHSDRGSQYTSEQFQKLMSDHGVACAMSRSGNVWDTYCYRRSRFRTGAVRLCSVLFGSLQPDSFAWRCPAASAGAEVHDSRDLRPSVLDARPV